MVSLSIDNRFFEIPCRDEGEEQKLRRLGEHLDRLVKKAKQATPSLSTEAAIICVLFRVLEQNEGRVSSEEISHALETLTTRLLNALE